MDEPGPKVGLGKSWPDSQLFAFLHMAKQHKADLSALFGNNDFMISHSHAFLM